MTSEIPTGAVISEQGPTLRIRFKYQLGELVIAEWRPALIPVTQEGSEKSSSWPELGFFTLSNASNETAGYQLRRTSVVRFPRGLSRQGPWLCYSPREECLYFVNLQGTFDEYLKIRSPKSRQNLKRSVRRFMENNPEAFQVYTQPEMMALFHRESMDISNQTYQSVMLSAGLPDSPHFLRSMQVKASRGEARAYLLRLQGKAIAFAWCTAKGDAVSYEVIGYLPQHADLSPGTVLLYLILQDLFSLNKYLTFDFGSGNAFYKEAFATDKLVFADSYLVRPTLENRFKLWVHWQTECFSTWVGNMLDRMGLKKKIRQWMRKGTYKLRA